MWNRRDVLRTGATALAVSVAGCLGGAQDSTADDPSVRWDRRFTARRVSLLRRVVPTADGGFVAVGSTATSDQGPSDGFVVRTDADGVERWRLTVPSVAVLLDVVETPDGGFVAVGNDTSRGPYLDGWAVGVAPDGTERWRRELSTDGDSDLAVVVAAPDGTYLAGGVHGYLSGSRAAWLVRLDADGTVRTDVPDLLPGAGAGIRGLVPTTDGLLVAGTVAADTMTGLVAAVATDGTVRWMRRYDTGISGIVAADGDGSVLLGVDYTGMVRPLLVSIDERGDVGWSYAYTPTADDTWFAAAGLTRTPDGRYLVSGALRSWADPSVPPRPVVAVVAPDGTAVEWARTYEGAGVVRSATALDDGFVLGGDTADGAARLLHVAVPEESTLSFEVESVSLRTAAVDTPTS